MSEFYLLFEAAGTSFLHVFSWPAFPMMLIGIAVGMFLGLVPGLGGLIGFALLIPFVVKMDPLPGMAMLLGMSAVITQADTLPAIVLGVPGTSQSVATALDGYPLAKQGQAGRALCAAYFAGILGAIISAAYSFLLIPVMKVVVFSFGQPEFFMLIVMGLLLVGSLAGRSLARGLIMAGFGLLLSMVTLETSIGAPRYAGDIIYLWDGIPLIPVVLGVFAVPEIIDLVRRKSSIAENRVEGAMSGLWTGIMDNIRNAGLVLKASTIGAVAGFIPGIGGQVAEWMAYGAAVSGDKDKASYGKGNIRGVIAPEAGTAAEKPGAIIPTVVFGIPGNAGMALLLGVFLVWGLKPGPEMVTTKLEITLGMMWIMIIASIIAAFVAIVMQRWLIMVCYIRPTILFPMVLGTMLIGATMATLSFGDVLVFLSFAILGYIFKHLDWPRVPLIMGLIMGKLAEQYLFLSINLHGFDWVSARPLTWLIAFITFLIVFLPIIRRANWSRGIFGRFHSGSNLGETDAR